MESFEIHIRREPPVCIFKCILFCFLGVADDSDLFQCQILYAQNLRRTQETLIYAYYEAL